MVGSETVMAEIHKRILTDNQMNPVAVQIDYEEWLEIERLLHLSGRNKATTNLASHMGRLDWPVDGLEYQHQIRSEWE